ncbi:MAG: hypothetical protein IPJ40_21360 [Saprospirales bacterium]|nr:hypothetical protein [Saprospirales bacterium]
MPQSWLNVRQFFVENLQKKSSVKLISKEDFRALCDQHQVREITRELLFTYLHHGGFLYWHEKLENQIIADQRLALEAIYKPYDRNKNYYREFRDAWKGQIPGYRLFEVLAPAMQTTKWLFLSFMESCGFVLSIACVQRFRSVGGRLVCVSGVFAPGPNRGCKKQLGAQGPRTCIFFAAGFPGSITFDPVLYHCIRTENAYRACWQKRPLFSTSEGLFKVEMD